MGEPLAKIRILPFEGTSQRDLKALIEDLALFGIGATLLPQASIMAP